MHGLAMALDRLGGLLPCDGMLKPPVSVSMAFVRGMLEGVEARGLAVEPFLAAADIDPQLLRETSARVTGEQYVDLFRAITRRLNDDGLGFFSRPLKAGSFALMVRSALGAPTMAVALRRIARTFNLLQDDVEMVQVREGELAGFALRFAPSHRPYPNFMHELLLRVFWRALAWLIGGRLPAVRFDLAFPCPPYAGSYRNVLPCELRFDQPQTVMWFAAQELDRPVRRDEAALRSFMADAQSNIILPRRRDDEVTVRVRLHLQSLSPGWPDLAGTAQALHMSVSTLQRNLALEGTSFQTVKDELRRDLAISRLVTTTVPLVTLASELGFSDSAAFQRAFKCWTGSPPGAYRRRA
jgi:AraC-like DNA-binding protein